jgi:hypothetical protein
MGACGDIVRAMETQCPVCGGECAGGDLVMVCASCHRHLGGVVVRNTGEFMAPSAAALAAAGADIDAPAGGREIDRCSWCSKPRADVRKILTSGAVGICDECVALCADILTAELGDDWR